LKQPDATTGQLQDVGRAWYFGLKVENLRPWRRATNCRVYLTALYHLGQDGIFYPEPMSVPLQFQWAIPQFNPIAATVSSEGKIADFGRLVEGNCGFEPVLYVCTFNFNPNVGKDQVAWYSVQIEADDLVSPSRQVFEVFWDGDWADQVAQIRQHLRIREVPYEELAGLRGLPKASI
jgi:hypothetical protein